MLNTSTNCVDEKKRTKMCILRLAFDNVNANSWGNSQLVNKSVDAEFA